MQVEMDHSLINLNQMRHNSATVQDNPFSPSPLFIETAEAGFVLPLEISGTNILANTRTPTDGELANCRHVILTSAHPWNPHNVRFPKPVRSVEEELRIGMRSFLRQELNIPRAMWKMKFARFKGDLLTA